jgi:hypothetical protein
MRFDPPEQLLTPPERSVGEGVSSQQILLSKRLLVLLIFAFLYIRSRQTGKPNSNQDYFVLKRHGLALHVKFIVTAGHVAAGRVSAVTTLGQRPGPLLLATPESLLSDARLRDQSRGRSVRHASPSPLEPPFAVPTGPDFGRVAGHVPVASLITCLARP